MGMDLHSENGERLWLNIFDWRVILTLARRFGWKPNLTAEEGGYLLNEGQRVNAEDAEAIAEALELALQENPTRIQIKPEEILQDSVMKALIKAVQSEPNNLMERASEATDFGDWTRLMLKKFIAFCRKGSFEIW